MPDSNLVWHRSGAFLMMMTTRVCGSPRSSPARLMSTSSPHRSRGGLRAERL